MFKKLTQFNYFNPILSLIIIILGFLFYPQKTDIYQPKNKILGENITAIKRHTGNPKIANYYLSSDQNFDYQKLASYDLVILPIDTQIYNQEFFVYARTYNPDIIILAYTPIQSVYTGSLNDQNSFNYKLNQDIKKDWWLKDPAGNLISSWPQVQNINITSGWQNWFPSFVQNKILSNGLWDGIFYDMTDKEINWLNNGNLDLNNDGQKDVAKTMNTSWQTAMENILATSRKIFAKNIKIVLNGSVDENWLKYINGIMLENFPTPWLGDNWSASMNLLKKYQQKIPAGQQKIFILNSLSQEIDTQKNRFHLVSALLENIYFSSDQSIAQHEDLRWFSEYDLNLGQPLNQAYNLLTKKQTSYASGVWRRDYQKAIVLVNSTGKKQKIKLEKNYQKINNTDLIKEIVLAPEDGIILLNPTK
ncbi:MAG TPA: putative glycoside hydrolase [bacterium]|nr:putative glycoside hydrolase [bacterium]